MRTPSNFPNTLPSYNAETGGLYDESPICVRVFFHIVRTSSGTGGFDPSDIPTLMTRLSESFNPHNIIIANAGQDFINDDTYAVEFNDGEFNALSGTQNVSNAINFYLLPVNPTGYAGRASAIPGNSLVVGSGFILTSTSPHELGHCLNLFHTHHQLETNNCTETATNCSSCGDFVCDTPIDPLLSCGSNVDPFTCAYTGGGGFNPDTRNLMSYSCRAVCRNRFTAEQGLRMRTSLIFDPLLSQFVTTDCIKIIGSGSVCLSSTNTYQIQNPPGGATYDWTILNTNIAQIQGPNNQPTVNVVRVNDGATVLECRITLPTGQLFTSKNIQVGVPSMTNGSYNRNGQLQPLAIFNSTNTTCLNQQTTVTGLWQTANSVTWTGPGYSHPSTWYDAGFNQTSKISTLKLSIYQTPGTGFWAVTGTNGCGSTVYNIAFDAASCSNSDPCVYYRVSPNPSKDGNITISQKPAPIPCEPTIPKIDRVNIYNSNGTLLQSRVNTNATKQYMQLSSNQKGFVIVEIISGKHTEKHKVIIQ